MTQARVRFTLACLLAFLAAVALRLWPLLHSPLPFNPDGIVHAGNVARTASRGTFPLSQMAVDDLQFTSFLTILQAVTGHHVLYIAQPVIAVVGAVPVLLVIAAARRLGARYDARWARYAGVLAGGLLAVEGLYLHRSMPVDEQTLGLLFVPLAAYAVASAWTDRRWLVVLAVVLVALPPTHNLDSTITGVLLVAAAVFYAARDTSLRGTAAAFAGALLYWLYLAGYMVGLASLTPAALIQSARITDVPGLFLAWVVLAAFTGAWFTGKRARTQRAFLFAGFAAWFVLLAVNAVVPVFPGLPATNPVILAGVSLLVVPALAAAYGAPVATGERFGVPFTALLAAVFGFVGLTLTAALTADYLNTLYRAQTFVHFPALAFAALGVVALANARDWRSTDATPTILAVVLVVAAAASIPVAYGGLDVLPYKGVTTEAEFEASSFAVEHVEGAWASDDHLTRITRYYGGNHSFAVLPVFAWMHGGPPPSCPVLSQDSWTTTGGQFYPKPPARVSASRYASFLQDRNVVYSASAPDTLILSTPLHAGDNGC